MIKKSILISIIVFIFLLPASCAKRKFNLPVTDITITKADGSTSIVKAELAVKEEERNHGFMERKVIPEGTGMLFVFEKDQQLSFWMKNTPHALSIAYIDSKGKIRDIFNMTPFSLSPILSTVSVRYALEVPEGWFEKNNIKEGDYISLNF